MPDISMCANQECPLKAICYRNPASGTKPSEYQTFFHPVADEFTGCDYFWEKQSSIRFNQFCITKSNEEVVTKALVCMFETDDGPILQILDKEEVCSINDTDD